MKYQRARTIEVLAKGNFHDYDWYVLSLGTYPTAYVDVGNDLYKEFEKYDTCDIPIECHGGVTYRKDALILEGSMEIGNFIGWDYGHAGDYVGYYGGDLVLGKDKKWTTEEIVEEVENVCKQLHNLKNADNMFFSLGYEKSVSRIRISYEKIDSNGCSNYINFNLETKTFYKVGDYGEIDEYITMPELKAINVKCKELGWND